MFVLDVDKSKIATTRTEMLVSGSVNIYDVNFNFSSDWTGLDKVVVFRTDGIKMCFPLINDTCKIPWEVVETTHGHLYIGVYGTKNGNLALPTVWKDLGAVVEGVIPCDRHPQDPTPDIYDDLLSKIEDLGKHPNLDERTLPDQHPIEAVSGLDEKLKGIPEPMTSEELRKLLMEGVS